MDETTFRIMDALSRELGNALSINELTKWIEELHGSAYYANIYKAMRNLNNEGIINLTKTGRSSLVSLNFRNYTIIDLLTEMELKRKHEILKKKTELQLLLADIDKQFKDLYHIKSICLINPEMNMKLNRAEFLILLHTSPEETCDGIRKAIQTPQRTHDMKIDYLMINKDEFLDLLKSEERNPLREMLSDKIVFFNPQAFWMEIIAVLETGIHIRLERRETNPAKISEQDLVYNLTRFGYKETGTQIEQGENICVEYIVTSILMQNDARRIQAIPIILAKNRANYNLLIFLAQKYEQPSRLLGLLKALNRIKPMEEVGEAIRGLEATHVKEIKASVANIREKMRLYHAIG